MTLILKIASVKQSRALRTQTIKVYFTVGKTPVDASGKMTLESTGTFVSETEVTCNTPNFE